MANIKRAVDDRTAKEMLGESFRRQLLMDGQYGSLAFIATHAGNHNNIRTNHDTFSHNLKFRCGESV